MSREKWIIRIISFDNWGAAADYGNRSVRVTRKYIMEKRTGKGMQAAEVESSIDVKRAAEILGCHEKTVLKMAKNDPSFPAYRIGRRWLFLASSLDAWRRAQLNSPHHQRTSQEGVQ
jgi:excisionase family DNA binding protein